MLWGPPKAPSSLGWTGLGPSSEVVCSLLVLVASAGVPTIHHQRYWWHWRAKAEWIALVCPNKYPGKGRNCCPRPTSWALDGNSPVYCLLRKRQSFRSLTLPRFLFKTGVSGPWFSYVIFLGEVTGHFKRSVDVSGIFFHDLQWFLNLIHNLFLVWISMYITWLLIYMVHQIHLGA